LSKTHNALSFSRLNYLTQLRNNLVTKYSGKFFVLKSQGLRFATSVFIKQHLLGLDFTFN